MLHINDLTFRIEGRPLFDGATAAIPSGHRVGLVGRNGAGKTTLLRLITGELAPDAGSITVPGRARIGHIAQEAPGGEMSVIDWVLAADGERAQLLLEAESARDPERIAEVHQRLSDIGAHAAPARAARILAGLGFDEPAQHRPCRELSGGWRMRVALACVLFLEPEILLLDEPTNYLDLEGAIWLESYLETYPHTVLIVSHDRDLLNRAVNSILHLENGTLKLYAGGYDAFEEARRERQRLVLKLKKKQDEQRRHIEAFVSRFRAQASKARQAQSRIKALARMQPIAAEAENRALPFAFPQPAKMLASPLLRFESAAAGYAVDAPVLSRLNLRIDQDDRIALLGQNGNGKSTFARLVAGRLAPVAGQVLGAQRVTIGYFAQHQLDELDPFKSPYECFAELMQDATEAQRRSRLGACGFGADKADTKAGNLSGGEKARLLLALATFRAPHLLVLDEPTNHLDVDAREALIHALNDYAGAVIMISHDRHLIEACAERLWVVAAGTVTPYMGDLDDYSAELLSLRGVAREPSRRVGAGARDGKAERRRDAAQRRTEVAPLKRALQSAEKSMSDIAAELARIDEALSSPELYMRDSDAAQQLSIKRGQVAGALAAAEDAWLAASEAYQAAVATSDS
jgi:ATP-binding cassette subfamily F protein 3